MIKSVRWYPLPTAILLAALAFHIGASSNFLSWAWTPASGLESGHLVRIYSREATNDRGRLLPYSTYLYLREHTVTLSGLIGFSETTLRLSTLDGMGVGEVSTKVVSGNYFPLLGKQAHVGRTLVEADERRPSGLPPVVLSFEYWTRQWNSEPRVVGKVVRLNERPFEIVGVLGPAGTGPDVWIPLCSQSGTNEPRVALYGRTKPGIGVELAQAEMNMLLDQWQKAYVSGAGLPAVAL